MHELIEFRVNERNAHLVFGPDEGKVIGRRGVTRKIELSSSDPRLSKMGKTQEELLARGETLYGGWLFHRQYSAEELAAGKLFRIIPTCFFEPMGEECGTVYDESAACSICGAGRRQVSDLELNTASIPKRADIAVTFAGEWVLSRRLADFIEQEQISGVVLRPVRHHGKEGSPVSPNWVQPVITSSPVDLVPPTHFAIDPAREDLAGAYRCPLGHVAGLNIVSEAYVDHLSWKGEDIVQSKQFHGRRSGLLVPQPFVVISLRFYRLLMREKTRGFRVEVAHLT